MSFPKTEFSVEALQKKMVQMIEMKQYLSMYYLQNISYQHKNFPIQLLVDPFVWLSCYTLKYFVIQFTCVKLRLKN